MREVQGIRERRVSAMRSNYVACIGRDAFAWVGNAAPAMAIPISSRRGPVNHLRPGLRCLVIGSEQEGLDDAELDKLRGRANSLGAGVVDLRRDDPGRPPQLRRVVDAGRTNPVGFKNLASLNAAVVPTRPAHGLIGEVAAAARATGRWTTVELFAGQNEATQGRIAEAEACGIALSGRPSTRAETIDALREYCAVVDSARFHVDADVWAEQLIALAAAGVPLVVDELPESVGAQLGPDTHAALGDFKFEMLGDPVARERASVRLRQAALVEHSREERWREIDRLGGATDSEPPSVSVLLATNRPEYLAHAAAQVAAQSYQPLELVVVLHGMAFDSEAEEVLRREASVPTMILRVGDEATLGAALNLALEAAGGDLVTKMDDDDWYSPEHITDLVLAREYSGAHLIGKASEFIYLRELDITIRRWAEGGERFLTGSTKIAGGTLMMARDDLLSIGGFRDLPRAVDQRLREDVVAQGGDVYRAHGFGYVLNRHSAHQTWSPEVDYFLQQSAAQWRGLRLDVAAA